MAPTIAQIVKRNDAQFDEADRVAKVRVPMNLKICDYDPTWPQTFLTLKSTISKALGSTALSIEHAGSTSVPGLPAKGVIDIDLIVADASDEAAYVPALEAAGFHFILREPQWNNHRFFRLYEPAAALHVFGPEDPEPVRHRIFREWLAAHPEDMERYAEAKRKASDETSKAGDHLDMYNARKQDVILDILNRAFRSLGYIE